MSPSSPSPSFGWGRIAEAPRGWVYRVRGRHPAAALPWGPVHTVFLSQGLPQEGIPTLTGKSAPAGGAGPPGVMFSAYVCRFNIFKFFLFHNFNGETTPIQKPSAAPVSCRAPASVAPSFLQCPFMHPKSQRHQLFFFPQQPEWTCVHSVIRQYLLRTYYVHTHGLGAVSHLDPEFNSGSNALHFSHPTGNSCCF